MLRLLHGAPSCSLRLYGRLREVFGTHGSIHGFTVHFEHARCPIAQTVFIVLPYVYGPVDVCGLGQLCPGAFIRLLLAATIHRHHTTANKFRKCITITHSPAAMPSDVAEEIRMRPHAKDLLRTSIAPRCPFVEW